MQVQGLEPVSWRSLSRPGTTWANRPGGRLRLRLRLMLILQHWSLVMYGQSHLYKFNWGKGTNRIDKILLDQNGPYFCSKAMTYYIEFVKIMSVVLLIELGFPPHLLLTTKAGPVQQIWRSNTIYLN